MEVHGYYGINCPWVFILPMYFKYFTSSLDSICIPLHEILKFDCDLSLDLEPNKMDSVFPRCNKSLLSTKFRKIGGYHFSQSEEFWQKILCLYRLGKKSFAFTGCTLWNALPSNIRNVNSVTTFKTAVKFHLLDSVLI